MHLFSFLFRYLGSECGGEVASEEKHALLLMLPLERDVMVKSYWDAYRTISGYPHFTNITRSLKLARLILYDYCSPLTLVGLSVRRSANFPSVAFLKLRRFAPRILSLQASGRWAAISATRIPPVLLRCSHGCIDMNVTWLFERVQCGA